MTDTERGQIKALARRLCDLLDPSVDLMRSSARDRLWDVYNDLVQIAAATGPRPHLWFMGCGVTASYPNGAQSLDKIGAVKAIRALTGVGLAEAKNIMDTAPQDLGPLDPEDAEVIHFCAKHHVEWRTP